MPRKALDKVPITPEILQLQKDMRAFLKRNPEIHWKELRPHGFEINIGTIPDDKAEEFLNIANQNEPKQ